MKTRDEVEALKVQWLADGSWDIESTEGFEDYREELLAFSREAQAAQEKRYAEMVRRRGVEMGLHYETKHVEYLIALEGRIESLAGRVERLEAGRRDR